MRNRPWVAAAFEVTAAEQLYQTPKSDERMTMYRDSADKHLALAGRRKINPALLVATPVGPAEVSRRGGARTLHSPDAEILPARASERTIDELSQYATR